MDFQFGVSDYDKFQFIIRTLEEVRKILNPATDEELLEKVNASLEELDDLRALVK
jgi:hypothetical protein